MKKLTAFVELESAIRAVSAIKSKRIIAPASGRLQAVVRCFNARRSRSSVRVVGADGEVESPVGFPDEPAA
jgi:hypothetical protein